MRTWPAGALALKLERLSADWQAQCGHRFLVVESCVDSEWLRDTANEVTGGAGRRWGAASAGDGEEPPPGAGYPFDHPPSPTLERP